MKGKLKVELDVETLKKIANYYGFPFAVFFMDWKKRKVTIKRQVDRQRKKREIAKQIIELLNELIE